MEKDLYDVSKEDSDILELSSMTEHSEGSSSENLISKEKIQKILRKNLSLKEREVFQLHNSEKKNLGGLILQKLLLRRKKIVYYYVTEQEFSVDVSQATGNTELAMVTKEQINSNLEKMPQEDRKKITHVHLGCVKVLITTAFREGLDTPFKCAFMDRRIVDNFQSALFGGLNGNLYDDLNKYKQAKSNLDELQKLGACLLHGVDATKMKSHSYLKMQRFDRVIFNFPHAGFHGKEDDLAMIKMHKVLVLGFFKNASRMLTDNGEIHVNHKTSAPFNKWDIEELAMQSILKLIERADFHKKDYPGYNNKRGDSSRCDEPFPLGMCSTFKFIHNPRAVGKAKRRQRKSPATTTTTSVDLNYYPQPSHPSKLNDSVASFCGLPNGYTVDTTYNLFNNVEHKRDVPRAGYSSTHDMNPSSQRLLQPMQPLKPMESLNSFQPWPTSPNVRYSQINHIRTMDIVPPSLGTRNEGYQISRGTSNYSQEARGGTLVHMEAHVSGLMIKQCLNSRATFLNCIGEPQLIVSYPE